MSVLAFEVWDEERATFEKRLGQNRGVFKAPIEEAKKAWQEGMRPSRFVAEQVKAKLGRVMRLGRSLELGDRLRFSDGTEVLFMDVTISKIGPLIVAVMDDSNLFVGRVEEIVF